MRLSVPAPRLRRENALAAGFDHHLIKPVDTARLAVLLTEIGRFWYKRVPSYL
jgi:CheY-like chemotaxis protein